MSGPVVLPARSPFDPRNYAKCERCGHEAGRHTTTACVHGHGANLYGAPPCDCKGWKRDVGWPPPEYVAEPAPSSKEPTS